ncbi:DNA-binding response regulator, OmpR family, contains REC and winged-helix (wHTH) domain [Pedococcus cremeus]|uniref:DNA-binding response regulator, OmpR family, contains REC and winged-helix (WHTH) domain n=1 Tax=Pedococcus cremeus TaxID=587636 RepID=A0A1H9THS1_9MICO|nr:DNA-binding response regulator, OmpR family, contains REC and winged-helix (wHTH) domain [Pedococcus cremeus]
MEDDANLSGMLMELFDEEGYEATLARDGQEGLHQGLVGEFDLMVVDRGLPAVEGVDLVGRLRSRGIGVPILVLTARNAVSDRVEGLDAGAQDYLGKPFDIEELLARLRALVRPASALAEELPIGARRRLVLAQNVVVGDARTPDVTLSPREAELLATMARHPRRVFTRDELLARVFDGAGTSGAVDTYVHYLRRKLGTGVVETVHGVGYRLGSA